MTATPEYSEWEETLEAIVAVGGVTLLLGGTDVGKTTFTRLLVNRALAQGHRVAVLDADLGQSEIGPPACIGLGFADAPVLALSDLPPQALAFLGSVSPPGHLPEYLVGTRRLADLAAGRFLVVDTGGYIQGHSARRLHQNTFDLLAPTHVVALQRRGELEPMLAPMRRRDGCRLHTPAVPAQIGTKPASFRAQRRTMRFAAYFAQAQEHTISLDEVTPVGTWLGGGTPLAAHLLRFLNQTLPVDLRVYYAEQCGRHLGLMINRPLSPDAPGLGMALEQLKASEVSLTVAPRLKHLLLGLEGANGKLLGLGLLEAINFRRRTLGVLTPVRAPAAARILRFGTLRIRPDGSEAGTLQRDEL